MTTQGMIMMQMSAVCVHQKICGHVREALPSNLRPRKSTKRPLPIKKPQMSRMIEMALVWAVHLAKPLTVGSPPSSPPSSPPVRG